MNKKRLVVEALTYGTMIVRAIQLADEGKRLYRAHKPKPMGFAPPKRRWFKR
jgi:hypothetical protein